MLAGTAFAAVPVSGHPTQLLKHADIIKTSNHAEFMVILKQLVDESANLSHEQQLYLQYLQAWQSAYRGNYENAAAMADEVVNKSTDPTLRFRAGVFLVNNRVNGSHYEEAFARLSELLTQLPQVTDRDARAQGLGVASFLYVEAGQYSLATTYADQLLKENPDNEEYVCKARYLKLAAIFKSGNLRKADKQFQDGSAACTKAGDIVFASGVRYYMASVEIREGQPAAAIKLLQKSYADVRRTSYPRLISQFDASLAQAYWQTNQLALAKQFAMAAEQGSIKNEYTEPLITAYKLLYLIAQKQGNFQTALAFHERYMDADKGYLNEVSAKALAYQTVKQQVLAKKLQIDALDKQNRILQLQRALDKKAIETTRLYVILLLTVLAFIAFVAYRIKRSQLRFMRMARRDGLTGLFNRQHFLDEAQRQLQYCRKSARDACLVLIDLDHFKNINDTHGHVVGDEVLKRAVMACQAHLRSTDVFGRLGGEEFGILLPECSLERVNERVEQLRLAVAEIPPSDALCVPVSASFGVATTVFSGYELRQLLIHADDALYQAKNTGRNRAVVFDDADSLRQAGMRKSRVGTPVAEPTA